MLVNIFVDDVLYLKLWLQIYSRNTLNIFTFRKGFYAH